MHLLIDASLPRSVADIVRRHGHEATDVRDVGLGDAADELIAAHARTHGIILMSRDFDFADVRNYPPAMYRGLIVFDVPHSTSAASIRAAVGRLLEQPGWIEQLSGTLAIVSATRVRIRRG
jgi:hypothetical protein